MSRDGAEITVVIGSAYGETSPVQTASETLYVEGKLDSGAELELPVAEELAVYVIDGSIRIAGNTVSAGKLAVLANGSAATVSAEGASHVMICGGATLAGERTIWWNFVSSSRERLEKAKRDWREGKFAEVPGETDFIPLPE